MIEGMLNRVHHSDCLEGLRRLPDESIDVIVTSPPYWKGFEYEAYFNSYKQYLDWCEKWLKECKRVLKPTGTFYLNVINDSEITIRAFELMEIATRKVMFKLHDKVQQIDLNMISYLILNEIEAKEISKCANAQKALAYFREKFPDLKVMLTLGSKGCIYQDEKEQKFCPIFKVDAVDTTGAGDTFTGYFVGGIANENKIEKILKIASCASAISVTREGAAPSIPYMDEVMEQINCLKANEVDMKAEILRIKIEQYFDENLMDASLNGLANFLGYSPIYTSSLVKKITDETYKKFLQKKRLEVSATLLLQTDLSINEIVKKVGYENASFFRKIFEEKYGTTPLNYRKRKVK